MKIHWLLSGFFFLVSYCGSSQEIIDGKMEHDGLERSWLTYLPSAHSPDEPLPLLICMHGFTGSSENILQSSGFNDIAEEENFIVVYPQGSLIFGLSHWNIDGSGLTASDVDDVGFLSSMIAELEMTYSIDETRVYACGMSNGGFMSFRLACELSEQIAAVASVTGSMSINTFNKCDPQHQMPVLQIHGDDDPIVPYLGDGMNFKAIDEVIEFWRDFNECGTDPIITDLVDSDSTDGTTVTTTSYVDGRNCSTVDHYLVNGGGHEWPGSSGNMDIDASSEIWNFFKNCDLNGLIGCSTGYQDLMPFDLNVYPNPAADRVYLSGLNSEPVAVSIFDPIGKRVVETSVFGGEGINVSQLNEGIYILLVNEQYATFVVER